MFLEDAPLLDTRAPLEFQRGSFPGAVNIPLMSDDERAQVGTCYKKRGQEAAIELGHELVSGALREQRLAAWQEFSKAHPRGFLYCFRGGLRSELVQQWLRESGVDYPRVRGGYKAMRQFLLETLEAQATAAELWLVAGATGSGKTRLVNRVARSIDLEGLANHRGSAFGQMLTPQPSQIDFENAIAIALLRLAQGNGPIVLEDEGRLIGRLALPETLRTRMAEAPLLLLEYPLAERVEVVLEDYVIDLGERFSAAFGPAGPERHRVRLIEDLGRTRKRLGAERHALVEARMAQAFDEQANSGSLDAHRDWITRLLRDYYDPMYAYQLEQRGGSPLVVGRREELVEFVAQRSPSDAR